MYLCVFVGLGLYGIVGACAFVRVCVCVCVHECAHVCV